MLTLDIHITISSTDLVEGLSDGHDDHREQFVKHLPEGPVGRVLCIGTPHHVGHQKGEGARIPALGRIVCVVLSAK